MYILSEETLDDVYVGVYSNSNDTEIVFYIGVCKLDDNWEVQYHPGGSPMLESKNEIARFFGAYARVYAQKFNENCFPYFRLDI